MVVGDRETHQIEHFSPLKKRLQRLGSAVVRRASGTGVPDATSGFRAYNREAALQIQVVSKFTYTLETLIQAGKMLVAVEHTPIRTNPQTRESRLFPSMWAYVRRNARLDLPHLRALRADARVLHRRRGRGDARAPLIWARFLWFFFSGEGEGHVQSLILGSTLLVVAVQLAALGVIGDILAGSRACCSSGCSSACAGWSSARASSRRTTSRAPPRPASAPTTAPRRPRHRQGRGARGGEAVTARPPRPSRPATPSTSTARPTPSSAA